MNLTFARYATDPMLAGNPLGSSSRLTIRAGIKAALAEPLTADERLAFDKIGGGREPPSAPASELVIIAGRASGKTQSMAALVVYLATCRDWPCDPGQIPVVLLLAADREQATVAFRYVLGQLQASPVLSREIDSTTKDRIVLRSGVEIQVATSDFRAVRGRSIVAAVCDEIAFWPITPDSASPDTEVLTALRPGLARFRGSLLICISTPYSMGGALYEYDRRYYGQNDARVLVLKGATRDFNPTFPEDVIADALQKDPAAAAAEYLCQYRTDVASFIDIALVDSLTRSEPRELPRRSITSKGTAIVYVAGIDTSGGRGDAAACSVAHWEDDKVVVDACRRWPAPHDPKAVAAQVSEFLAGYGLQTATGDHYGAELTKTIYADVGVTLLPADAPRSEQYLRLLPLMTTGRVELPPDPTLRVELLGLERKTGRNGKDSVDHRPGAHDDLANAVALAAVAASQGMSAASVELAWAEPSTVFDDYAFRPSDFSRGWFDGY
ncbi:MAG: hypothetical protein JSR73_10690 [Proteobacteria bacterium]|nr:hypothetical protein [Pseudomonadota bacterium]